MDLFLYFGITLCLVVSTRTLQYSETDILTLDKSEYQFFPTNGEMIRFRVKAPHDAHIVFASGPAESHPMWEVIIGGWKNSLTVIRKNGVRPYNIKYKTPNILKGDEFRGFMIRWSGNKLTVSLENEDKPFLVFPSVDSSDPELDSVTHFGIRTQGANGEWRIREPVIESEGTTKMIARSADDRSTYEAMFS